VRKSMKTKGRLRGEARIAVRNRLKIKDGDFGKTRFLARQGVVERRCHREGRPGMAPVEG
jgi:hypothetical protein